jgi:uncharacterized coiled-coil protein SlyX
MSWNVVGVTPFMYNIQSGAGQEVHAPTKETALELMRLLNTKDATINDLNNEFCEQIIEMTKLRIEMADLRDKVARACSTLSACTNGATDGTNITALAQLAYDRIIKPRKQRK